MKSPTPPKGSLEDLFRHHLAGEAADASPRSHVWEQLDNRLLLAENTRYRRRLRTHRWALAASLLLASLAGGGWWQSQRGTLAPQPTQPLAAGRVAPADAGRQPGLTAASGAADHRTLANRLPAAASSVTASTSHSVALGKTATSPLASTAGSASAALAHVASAGRFGTRRPAVNDLSGLHDLTLAARSAGPTSLDVSGPLAPHRADYSPASTAGSESTNVPPIGAAGIGLATPPTGPSTGGALVAAGPQRLDEASTAPAYLTTTDQPTAPAAALDQLAPRLASLALADAAGLPTNLSAPALPEMPLPSAVRAWQFGVSYASGLFTPNVDFAKNADRYNAAFGMNSAAITQGAAAEYRTHLRPGLGQRLSFWASRRLGNGRWGLRGGLELSQQTASSATSLAFVGEQVADFGSTTVSTSAPLRGTAFRYRAASVSAEARYGHPAKTGFSLYGRVGALFSALLSARGEVEGNPEATRDYSLMSPSMPYRRLSASVRGGGGVLFQPAGHEWALSLGPVAEMGIMSLNADPQQDFWQQQRPYSFGLEAGLELGRAPKRTLGL